MARKKTVKHNDTELAQVPTTVSFSVIKKLRGNINNKVYSHEVGEKVEFNQFEATVFKNFIKED